MGICYVQLQFLNEVNWSQIESQLVPNYITKKKYGCSSKNHVIVFDVEAAEQECHCLRI